MAEAGKEGRVRLADRVSLPLILVRIRPHFSVPGASFSPCLSVYAQTACESIQDREEEGEKKKLTEKQEKGATTRQMEAEIEKVKL